MARPIVLAPVVGLQNQERGGDVAGLLIKAHESNDGQWWLVADDGLNNG